MTTSELKDIKARWGTPKSDSQYFADIHALIAEVERLQIQWRDHECEEIASLDGGAAVDIILERERAAACTCDDETATGPCPVARHKIRNAVGPI